MSILLIWQYRPEQDMAFVIESDHEMVNVVLASAGQYINGNAKEGDAIYKLNDWVATAKVEERSPARVIQGPFDAVVICGVEL